MQHLRLEDPFSRIRLLAHESFHRLQGELNLKAADRVNSHLDSEAGRLWLRMELRALARALRSDGKTARIAASDALLFRAFRHSLTPSAEELEATLEIQEGLAEYTGTVVALRETGESMSRVARAVESLRIRLRMRDRLPTPQARLSDCCWIAMSLRGAG